MEAGGASGQKPKPVSREGIVNDLMMKPGSR